LSLGERSLRLGRFGVERNERSQLIRGDFRACFAGGF